MSNWPGSTARHIGQPPAKLQIVRLWGPKMIVEIDVKPRKICDIAYDIGADWQNMSYCARPYWSAMLQLDTINDKYYLDGAREIVLRFLCNAGTWRGPVARAVKLELKQLAGIK
jgi:hypothetical protein